MLTIHRDASMYQTIPEGTWTLCFGWFMHPLFRMRYGFPLHDALRPLFVSFHCNKRDLLTDDAIAYLRRYGPVGCRDWTTVYLLLSAGVPAFFSGCLTTTVSTTFPRLDERPPTTRRWGTSTCPTAVPAGAPTYAHSDRAVRRRSFLENCDDAVDRLETYRRDLSAVVTSRLHAYLPLRSLGVPVEFRPGNLSDIRFDGLAGITDDEFSAMREGMLELLAGGLRTDPVGRVRGRGLRPLARADRGQGRRGGGPAARRRGAGRSAGRPRRAGRDRARQDGHVPASEPAGAGEPVHCAVFVTKRGSGHLAPLVRSLVAGRTGRSTCGCSAAPRRSSRVARSRPPSRG